MPRNSAGSIAIVVMLFLAASPRVVSAEMVSVSLGGPSGEVTSTLVSNVTVDTDSALVGLTGGGAANLDIDFSGPSPTVTSASLTGEVTSGDWGQDFLQILSFSEPIGDIYTFAHLPPISFPIVAPASQILGLNVTESVNTTPPAPNPLDLVIPINPATAIFDISLIGASGSIETYLATVTLPISIVLNPLTAQGSVGSTDTWVWDINFPSQIVITGEFTRVVPEPGSLTVITLGTAALLRRRST